MPWKIKSIQDRPESKEELIKRILRINNLPHSDKDIEEFLSPPPLALKSLLKYTKISLPELKKAATLINQSIKSARPIIVYGDYDVDGVCATAILWTTLHEMKANVLPFIPHRFDHGYGLSGKGLEKALTLFSVNQKPLIITVDNGVTGGKLIKKYQKKGIDFIITDHHQIPKDKLSTSAFIHSTKVCGTVIAFILSWQLSEKRPPLDLPALATICDQLPLVGQNRQIVIGGLNEIRKSGRIGLLSLIKEAQILDLSIIDTYHLGFVIGPRINAAGRLGHAIDALRLLCTKNKTQASQLALQLNDLNIERQDLTKVAIDNAIKSYENLDTLPPIIVSVSPDYHEGIIGLIAAKLSDRFHRPAIAISQGDKTSRASARSIDGIDITKVLRTINHLFIDLGGHAGAAGFTLSSQNIGQFCNELSTVSSQIDGRFLDPAFTVDLRLHPSQDLRILNQVIKSLAPFGFGFSQPVFSLHHLLLSKYKTVGQLRQHIQFTFNSDSGSQHKGIGFNQAEKYQIAEGDNVDVAFHLQENTFNGFTSLQLLVKNLQLHNLP